eukprot:816382-Amphidinium_carterae.1
MVRRSQACKPCLSNLSAHAPLSGATGWAHHASTRQSRQECHSSAPDGCFKHHFEVHRGKIP